MKATRWVMAIVMAIGGCGVASTLDCRETADAGSQPTPKTVSASDALKLALDALDGKRLLKDQEMRLTVTRVKNRWAVWIEYLPETFGGDVTVFVGNDRTVEILVGF